MRQLFLLLVALSPLCVLANAQDQNSSSLADAARQSRARKQQKDANDDQAKRCSHRSSVVAAKASHVITNEDLPEHPLSTSPSRSDFKVASTTNLDHEGNERQQLAEQFQSRIQDQNKPITELQNQIAAVSDSVHYAGGNCVSNCVQWNKHQRQKQQEVDAMKAQPEEAQRRLDQMRKAARQEGFGGSVSDPD